jgi:hypothetical protein
MKECKWHLCSALQDLWGKSYKKVVFLSGINGSKRAHMLKPQIKTMLITFFDIKGIVHFQFTPWGQIVEILKWFC